LEQAIHSLEGGGSGCSGGSGGGGSGGGSCSGGANNKLPTEALDSSNESSAKGTAADELDADHDNLAFVVRQLEAMAAGYGRSAAGGRPLAAQTRFYVERQGGRSVTSLLEKMFIKELHHNER
jgi:hypothetical protein